MCSQRGVEALNGDCLNLPFRSGIADGVLCIAVIHHLASHVSGTLVRCCAPNWLKLCFSFIVILLVALQERRRRAIQEIARVLCKGGRAMIYVWARDQKNQDAMSTYLKQNRKNRHVKPPIFSSKQDSEKSSSVSMAASVASAAAATTAVTSHPVDTDGTEYRVDLPLPVHVNRTNFKHSDVLVPWKLKGSNRQVGPDNEPTTYFRYYHVFEADELKRLCIEIPQIQILETKYDQGNWSVLLRKLP